MTLNSQRRKGLFRVPKKVVIAHHQPININPSKVRATLESSSENFIGNSSVAKIVSLATPPEADAPLAQKQSQDQRLLLGVLRQAQPFDFAQGGEPVEPDGEQRRTVYPEMLRCAQHDRRRVQDDILRIASVLRLRRCPSQ